MSVNDVEISTNFELNTCEAEYEKDPKIKREDVQQLVNWVEKQPHMPKVKGKFFQSINLVKKKNHFFEFFNVSPKILSK